MGGERLNGGGSGGEEGNTTSEDGAETDSGGLEISITKSQSQSLEPRFSGANLYLPANNPLPGAPRHCKYHNEA